MKQQNKRRGLFASIGAAVTAFAMIAGGALAANAAPFEMPDGADIVITKLSQPATPGDPATGAQITPPTDATPIAGVVFTAYEVPLSNDPGTNAWQQEIADMTLGDAADALDNGTNEFGNAVGSPLVFPATADNSVPANHGVTTLSNVPWGLYYVVETSTPAGVVPAAPFLVAVPMTEPGNREAWLDTIYVYPKNTLVAATKTVDEASIVQDGVIKTGSDNKFTWTITSDIPRMMDANGNNVQADNMTIADPLDTRLTLDSVLVEILDAAGDPVVGAGQLVTTDYEVDGSVTIEFETDGLAKLLAAGADHKLRTTITTFVNNATPVTPGDGTAIKNKATITINDNKDNKLVVETDTAQTNWGVISFTKEDKDENELAGAVFALYASKDDAWDKTNPLFTSAATDNTGQVTFNGVRTSDRLNGEPILDGSNDPDLANYQVYWIRETQAPSGFQLLAEPLPVVLMTDGKVYNATVNANGELTAIGAALTKVINVQNAPGFTLPLTGGIGTMILAVIGAGIVGAVLFFVLRRKDEDEGVTA